ncbi:MAG TPA: response regulator [Nitriliruptorales bacterium]
MDDRFRLLIVEDDDSVRALIAATVPEEWHVIEARDGMEALELARRYEPDAIVLDHRLPMLNGDEVCQILRRERWCRERCRIVAVTGSDDTAVRRAFSEAGADAFVNKPFSPVQLLDLIDAWEVSSD